jgi:hypothetical protein
LARQFFGSQRSSGFAAALELAKYGNDLISIVLTALPAR